MTNKCNVVVTPLNALKKDMKRLKASKIRNAVWTRNMGLPLPNLVMVSGEASTADFKDWVEDKYAGGHLLSVVLDEFHLPISASYRNLQDKGLPLIMQVQAPLLFLTATLLRR